MRTIRTGPRGRDAQAAVQQGDVLVATASLRAGAEASVHAPDRAAWLRRESVAWLLHMGEHRAALDLAITIRDDYAGMDGILANVVSHAVVDLSADDLTELVRRGRLRRYLAGAFSRPAKRGSVTIGAARSTHALGRPCRTSDSGACGQRGRWLARPGVYARARHSVGRASRRC